MNAATDSTQSWVIAFTAALAMIFTFGTTFSYGVLLTPLSDLFDIPTVVLSTVFSGLLFSFFIGAGIVGILATQYPSRAVITVCGLTTGIVSPALYVVDTYLGLAVVFLLIGMSLGTMYVVLAGIVPLWFEESKGAATGIIFMGNGLGLFILPPAWQLTITELGIRKAYLIIMGLTTVVFLLSGLICRRPPWERGTEADRTSVSTWLASLVRTRRFQLLFVGVGLSLGWYMMLAAFAIDLFAARGLSDTVASGVFGLVGGVSVVSRLGSGYVADYIGFRRTYLISILITAVGVGALLVPGVPILPIAVGFAGLGLGGIATMYIPVLLERFSPSKNTAIIGVFNVAIGIVALVVPPLGTAIIAYTGSYTSAIIVTVCMLLGAFVTVLSGAYR